jgi:hypothetical protein
MTSLIGGPRIGLWNGPPHGDVDMMTKVGDLSVLYTSPAITYYSCNQHLEKPTYDSRMGKLELSVVFNKTVLFSQMSHSWEDLARKSLFLQCSPPILHSHFETIPAKQPCSLLLVPSHHRNPQNTTNE